MTEARARRPGLYYPKLPTTWWLRNPRYFGFMLRELSSVFVAAFLVVLLVQFWALGNGPDPYQALLAKLRSPGWIIFHAVALAFALYHTVTWLNLTAVVQVVRVGERQVPPWLITTASFVAWGVVSLVVFFLLLQMR